jgi:hypothetical protein
VAGTITRLPASRKHYSREVWLAPSSSGEGQSALRFAHVAWRTLRPRASVCVKLQWTKKSACKQQSARDEKQQSFHGGTPFFGMDWEVQPW